jgi:hypothetical protein
MYRKKIGGKPHPTFFCIIQQSLKHSACLRLFFFYVTSRRISIELLLRRTLQRTVSLFGIAQLQLQHSTWLLLCHLFIVMATQKPSVFTTEEKMQTVQQVTTIISMQSTDPSFLRMTREKLHFNSLADDRRVESSKRGLCLAPSSYGEGREDI